MNDLDLPRLLDDLAAAGLTLAVAESLTAGAVTSRIAEVPGASRVLIGGVSAYATRIKHEVLGVDAERLAEKGPVDALVARQMASGVRALLRADIGLSTTGVAGPGPQDGHPAGEVHIACVWREGALHRELCLDGPRGEVRAQAVHSVLALVRDALDSGRIPPSG